MERPFSLEDATAASSSLKYDTGNSGYVELPTKECKDRFVPTCRDRSACALNGSPGKDRREGGLRTC